MPRGDRRIGLRSLAGVLRFSDEKSVLELSCANGAVLPSGVLLIPVGRSRMLSGDSSTGRGSALVGSTETKG